MLSYGERFILTLFTNDPLLAAQADTAGIDRIGIDLETIGKRQRQGHLNTWISDHSEADLPRLRPSIRKGALFARCNPVHPGLAAEIERLLRHGVTVLMLPFFTSRAEAETFIRLVDGRATPVLLVETRESAAIIPELCCIDGVEEIHIGLNDMRLSLGWPSHFHVLASDFLVRICAQVLEKGLRLGVGGVGRAGDNLLPIPSDLVIAQLPRLGATASLVSRAFFNGGAPLDISHEVSALRKLLDSYSRQPGSSLNAQRTALAERLSQP